LNQIKERRELMYKCWCDERNVVYCNNKWFVIYKYGR